ncbi:helix-turn-helix domain-containing protein [Amycolatopsis anabasis]|uniref:helix-turn-helix domain-containing protein n=1 Tax=Amycolatopsis anabasis TaxID=1840409 RepID=UPI00131CC2E5|nr:helix-turn-helix transcriptional regulator [Amycolatopsis anabasis]
MDENGAYRPVLGGLRHRTLWRTRPPDGMFVRLLCGGTYQVSSKRKSVMIYECHACEAVYEEIRDHEAEFRRIAIALGGGLRRARLSRGWTLGMVCAALGDTLSVPQLSRFERAERDFTVRRLVDLCTVLGIPPGDLLSTAWRRRRDYVDGVMKPDS